MTEQDIEIAVDLDSKQKAALTRWLNDKMSRWAELETQLKPLKRESDSLKKEVKSRAEELSIDSYRHGGALLYSSSSSTKPSFEDVARELAETTEAKAFVAFVEETVKERTIKRKIAALKLSA